MSEEITEPQNNNESSDKTTEDIFYPKDDAKEAEPEGEKLEEVEKEETTEKVDDPEKKAETEEGKPEEYKLEYGESLTDEQKDNIESYAKDNELSSEKAQDLVKFQEDLISKHKENLLEQHDLEVTKWAEEIKADKEFGLNNLKENAQFAKTVVNKFGGEDFEKMLNDSGYGNHPLLFKTFARIGKAMANDKLVTGAQESKPKPSMEEVFYPSNF